MNFEYYIYSAVDFEVRDASPKWRLTQEAPTCLARDILGNW